MPHQNSVFHLVLKHVPWSAFERLVATHAADARVRRVTTKPQFAHRRRIDRLLAPEPIPIRNPGQLALQWN